MTYRRLHLLAALTILFVGEHNAIGAPTSGRNSHAGQMRLGRSIGAPNEGRLLGGAHLDDSAAVRACSAYSAGDVRWGLGPLVGMIERGAKTVRKKYPNSVLNVGQLSRAGGGEVNRHASHESGRDADIGFYVRTTRGNKYLTTDRFVTFRGDGSAPTWPGARFDDARNWVFVSTILTDPQVRIQYIFISTPLRARLLAYADKIGASATVRGRAAEVMAQPYGAHPHNDHFHVRIGCPNGMSGCIEYASVRRKPTHNRAACPIDEVAMRRARTGHAKAAAFLPLNDTPTGARKAGGIGLGADEGLIDESLESLME